ncbi:hypothetical protein OG369_42580 [Streptomyces sp. NBC_01221]|uniref:hypothetical protein n=1 Tax=Streptomyces sp. NBC_01221 TaxID=2903782 RepID=UPI002258E8C5|nr:hypothetical protein [Streptomyces sp. NBC_01221]MCX4792465.1 hypothetical protein [Streptomyces sp. NBC_01221]
MATFDGDSTLSSQTLPASGSMRSGALSAHRRSAPPIHVNDSSSSPLLKTPTANLAINGGSQHPDKRKQGGHGPTLADEVEHLLPTPVVADARDTANFRPDGTPYGEGYGMTLLDATRHLLPTPTATPYGNNQSPSPGAAVRPSLNSLAPTLRGAVSSPPSADGSTSLEAGPPGQLTIEIG